MINSDEYDDFPEGSIIYSRCLREYDMVFGPMIM